MTLAIRHVDVDLDAPVTTWPYEALVTVIERGSIRDWARVTREIGLDPWGPVARQVEEYLGYESPVGVGPLLQRAIARARTRAEAAERQAVAARVADLIGRSGLTTAEFASRIGTSRTRLSTYRNGRVIPSAALLLRMERTVERLEDRTNSVGTVSAPDEWTGAEYTAAGDCSVTVPPTVRDEH